MVTGSDVCCYSRVGCGFGGGPPGPFQRHDTSRCDHRSDHEAEHEPEHPVDREQDEDPTVRRT